MASLMDMVMGQLTGGNALQQIGGLLKTDEKTAGTATTAAVGALLGALSKNASNSAGADALSSALSKDHDGSVLDNLSGFLNSGGGGAGQGILRHVLGGKQQAVERGLGRATGLDSGSMGQLMTMVAPVVMGALGKAQRQQNMGGGDLSRLLDGERQNLEKQQPQAMGALSSLLDSDGDGDVDFGDLAKHGMGLLGKFFKR